MILKDRRNEFINNNMSLCENNCEYIEYNKKIKKSLCKCAIKKEISICEIINNKDKLLINFIDIKNTININLIKCYRKVFNKEGLLKNIGNYIISIIILLIFILSILFKFKGYSLLQNKIKEINQNIKLDENPPKRIKKVKKVKKVKKYHMMNSSDKINSKSDIRLDNSKVFNNFVINNNHILTKNAENNNNSKRITINYNDYEFNNLSYQEALISDKRTYLQFYFSLLKTNHVLIFTFYTNSDYNSKIIKIILFLFSFSLYLTVNALFFNDSTMHKIYEDFGEYNFIYQISNIIYSTIISAIISIIIKYLSLSEKYILKIKDEKKNKAKKYLEIINCLNIKFIIFFILCFLFLLFFWFYLTCFCGIYKNTQIHLIKDTLISFGLSLVYPLILNLLPGIFRISSLKTTNRECIYKISKYIQLIF